MKTVFYSEYKKFIIPEDNLIEAKSELELLQAKYPERKLILIPIRNFESVFNNLEIVERYELKFKQKLKANYHRYQKVFNTVFSILILIAIALWIIKFLIPHLDKNPVTGVFKDSKYIAYNKYDLKVWEYDEPEINIFEKDYYTDHFFKQIISIADIDDDGANEIIYVNNMGSSKMIDKDLIICCNSDNKIKWKYQIPRKNFSYDWESDSLQGDWLFRQVFVDDINSDGKKEVVANAFYCPFFPNRMVVLNNEGKLISEYWHSGYFNYVTDFDIDGDGKKELVAMGINNFPDYRCGCLLVFDPNVIKGSSFKTDPLKSGIKGTEKYYIIFPKTFMTKFQVSGFNIADFSFESGQNFEVNVLDGPIKRNVLNNAFLSYQFDKNMNVINISTSDQFLQVYNELLSEGKIQPIPNMKTYLDSLKTQVQWWDGVKFVNHPVINKNYLEAKNTK